MLLVTSGLIEATSNAGFCAGVCDTAGVMAIANVTMSVRNLMLLSPLCFL